MKAGAFAYHRPRAIAECIELLDSDENAAVVAGGQSLIPMMNLRLAEPSTLIDLNQVDSLAGFSVHDGRIRVGATTTQARLEDWAELGIIQPLVAKVIPLVGHRPIRNRGTVGGSISHADPAAEWGAVAVALDAKISLAGPRGTRTVAAGEFFLGPFMTARDHSEVVTEITLPVAGPGEGSGFRELSRRDGDFAIGGCAVRMVMEGGDLGDVRIALFGAVSHPMRVPKLEHGLMGARQEDWPMIIADHVEQVSMREDVHGPPDFKRHVAKHLIAEALAEAIEEARG